MLIELKEPLEQVGSNEAGDTRHKPSGRLSGKLETGACVSIFLSHKTKLPGTLASPPTGRAARFRIPGA